MLTAVSQSQALEKWGVPGVYQTVGQQGRAHVFRETLGSEIIVQMLLRTTSFWNKLPASHHYEMVLLVFFCFFFFKYHTKCTRIGKLPYPVVILYSCTKGMMLKKSDQKGTNLKSKETCFFEWNFPWHDDPIVHFFFFWLQGNTALLDFFAPRLLRIASPKTIWSASAAATSAT